jgi:GntR family transcriptional regulator/MocR family aminotransferase
MAQDYQISKHTVESAYSQLFAEGYIESHPQSGYFVSKDIENYLPLKKILQESSFPTKTNILYDFYPAQLHNDNFPDKLWARLHNKVMKDVINFGSYPQKQGEYSFRVQISKYLSHNRGVQCNPEQIIICSGFSDAMFIIATILKSSTSQLAIEFPGYSVVKQVFKNLDYSIENISINIDGISLENIEKSKSKLLYVTPSHQYPTGVTIPIANRFKLIQWATKNNAYIIEDDYDSELSYNNRPIPSLQGINHNNCVIYTGTFSKSLSPALRVSYLVLPTPLLPLYKEKFNFHFSGVSIDTQKTLELFIKDGYWEKHIRKTRILNKKKHDIMKESLLFYLKDKIKILREGSGLSIVIIPIVKIDWEKLEKEAISTRIKLYYIHSDSTATFQAICMGFGGFLEEEIPLAIETFSKIFLLSMYE